MPKKDRLPMGAIAATHRPGFKADSGTPKPKYRKYFVLPHDPLLSENIGKEQGPVMGTETEVIELEHPAGSGRKRKFHIVDEDLLKKIRRSSAAYGQFEAFEQRTPEGPLHPYETRAVKDRRARLALKRTRPALPGPA